MEEFFQWLSSNQTATTVFIFSFGFAIVAVALLFLAAFFQGREITLWPPKIGPRPEKKSGR